MMNIVHDKMEIVKFIHHKYNMPIYNTNIPYCNKSFNNMVYFSNSL